MEVVVEIVKDMFIPGSITFLLFGLIAGVIMLYLNSNWAKRGRRWLTLLTVVYLLLGLPIISNLLVDTLSRGFSPIENVSALGETEAIVVLGGGGATYLAGDQQTTALSEASTLRALEAVRLYGLLDSPWVIVSGGTNMRSGLLDPESEPLRETLMEMGIPGDKIILESDSQNTQAQAVNIPPLLESLGVERFILVTSPTHMRRSVLAFREVGLDPLPAISTQQSESQVAPGQRVIPDGDVLSQSKTAMREIMALIYYALRGWI